MTVFLCAAAFTVYAVPDVKELRAKAEQGDTESQYHFGFRYYFILCDDKRNKERRTKQSIYQHYFS